MRRTNNWSLSSILNIHIIVVITISHSFKIPTRSILKLARNIEPVPVFTHPLQWRSSISLINFKNIKSRWKSEECNKWSFPKLYPFSNSFIFINDFSFFKVKSCIRLHWRSLNEWLELVTWICRSSFKTYNSFNRFFSENWET